MPLSHLRTSIHWRRSTHRRHVLPSLLCFFCLLSPHGFMAHAATLAVGQPAPPLSANTLNGDHFDLTSARDKVLVINFWATWCSPCRAEMPALETYYAQHKADGLLVLAINIDTSDQENAVREIMRAYSFPAALAKEAQYAGYGRIWRLPMTFVIDRQGLLRKDGSVGDPKIDLLLLEKLVTPLLSK